MFSIFKWTPLRWLEARAMLWQMMPAAKRALSLTLTIACAIQGLTAFAPEAHADMVMQIAQTQQVRSTRKHTIGICHIVPNFSGEPTNATNAIDPALSVKTYMSQFVRRSIVGQPSVTIVKTPAHGLLTRISDSSGVFLYVPNDGYRGKDTATVLVEIADVKVNVIYFLQVIGSRIGNTGYEERCGKRGYMWRISVNGNMAHEFAIALSSKQPSSDQVMKDIFRSAPTHGWIPT